MRHPMLVSNNKREHEVSRRCWCRPYGINLFGTLVIVHRCVDDDAPVALVMLALKAKEGGPSHFMKVD